MGRLVLSRMPEEVVEIGDPLQPPICIITLEQVRGDKVRLSFESDAPIYRREVAEAIRREARAAERISPENVDAGEESQGGA